MKSCWLHTDKTIRGYNETGTWMLPQSCRNHSRQTNQPYF